MLQQDDYYPFGLEINTLTSSPKNEYLYNKKELQEEIQQYDYGARFYDPVIARWNSIDPLSETSRRWTPYNYVYNNPVRFIDPDGMKADSAEAAKEEQQRQADIQKELGQGLSMATNLWHTDDSGGDSEPGVDQNNNDSKSTAGDTTKHKNGGGKGNFRGGGQNDRDRNLNRYPEDFRRWYHKYYKQPGDPDATPEELEEIYKDWVEQGRPQVDFRKTEPLLKHFDRPVGPGSPGFQLQPVIKKVAIPVGGAITIGTIFYYAWPVLLVL